MVRRRLLMRLLLSRCRLTSKITKNARGGLNLFLMTIVVVMTIRCREIDTSHDISTCNVPATDGSNVFGHVVDAVSSNGCTECTGDPYDVCVSE